jgi:hypothetical protein
MKIKIVEANRQAINILLAEINGKSSAHTACDSNIFDLAESMENRLEDFGIAKKERSGAAAWGMSGGDVPSAYKYSRIVTVYDIARGPKNWFLIFAKRDKNYSKAAKPHLRLTASQRDIAIAKFSAQFSVQPVVDLTEAT